MRHGSLFSGIGGFDLAAQWMGWTNVFHCEIEPFPQAILKHYWPNAHSIGDIHDLTIDNYGNLLYLYEKDVIVMGQPRSTKYDDAVRLYESGMSIADCAEFYEISRQAMHKILTRRGCKMRSNLKHGDANHFYRGVYPDNSKKRRVQHIVEKAIKKGVLFHPPTCESCGGTQEFKDGRNGIQAHHTDYDKPLEVMWLCQKCHHEWHKSNQAINEKDEERTGKPSGAIDIVSGGFP